MKGFQKKYLKSLAHALKPVVYIGQQGFTNEVRQSIDEALDAHELIKLKFVEFKEKEAKSAILSEVEKQTECEMVTMIGHVAVLFRQQGDPRKRKIAIPQR